jgi:fatty aldehyde-generating acyl-ACP reductase
MRKFAFIVTAATIEQLSKFRPLLMLIPGFAREQYINNLMPFQATQLSRINLGCEDVEGVIIVCPLIKHQNDEGFILDRIIASAKIANSLGADIAGLNGCASAVADKNFRVISKHIKIPVTTGNAFSSWAAFEAIYRVAKAKNINLKECRVTVIGVRKQSAILCGKILSERVSSVITIPATDMDKNYPGALKNSDIIIVAEDCSIDFDSLKTNTIVCDISLCGKLPKREYIPTDITFIEGALIKLPKPLSLRINSGLPNGVVSAPLAETMLLALEGKFVSYSLGENINPDKLEEIADMSARHGFEVWVPQAPVI